MLDGADLSLADVVDVQYDTRAIQEILKDDHFTLLEVRELLPAFCVMLRTAYLTTQLLQRPRRRVR